MINDSHISISFLLSVFSNPAQSVVNCAGEIPTTGAPGKRGTSAISRFAHPVKIVGAQPGKTRNVS